MGISIYKFEKYAEFSCLFFPTTTFVYHHYTLVMPKVIIKVKIDMEKAPIAEKLKRCIKKKHLDVFTREGEWNSGKEYPHTFIRISFEMLERLNETVPPVYGIPHCEGDFVVPFRIHRDFITPIDVHE